MTTIVSPYIPRPQQAALHQSLTRFSVIVCHRRFGKTIMSLNHIIISMFQNNLRNPKYAYVAPEKSQAKDVVWKELQHYLGFIPGVKFNGTELKIFVPLSGGREGEIHVRGADNPDRIRGNHFDGVVVDEVAQMPRYIWSEILQPTLLGRDGKGWAIFIGTPKGKNLFEELYLRGLNPEMQQYGWSSHLLKASDTGILDAEIDMIKATTDPNEFEQEYECSFKAVIPGSYYGSMLQAARDSGRIGKIKVDINRPVITAWDIGMNDITSIWFAQYLDGKLKLIDYYESSNQPLKHYINVVKSKPYVYEYHIFPHDADQRSFNSGMTRTAEAVEGGLKVHVPKRRLIEDGINAVRSLLPIAHFDEERCSTGLEALANYHSVWNDKDGVQRLRPKHDWSSHASDAFRYLATGIILDKPDHMSFSSYPYRQATKNSLQYENFDPYDC